MMHINLLLAKKPIYKVRVGIRSMKRRLCNALMQLLTVIAIHANLIYAFEDFGYFDSWWYTLVAATTIGFGDFFPKTIEGKVTTIVMVIFIGIWLLTNFVGKLIEYFQERNKLKILGNWRWNLNKPIVIIGSPKNNAEDFFRRLLSQIRETNSLLHKDILIVSKSFHDGLPESLADKGAVLLNKSHDDKTLYSDKHIKEAEIIYVIAENEACSTSNSIIFNALSLLSESGTNAHIVAESTMDCDRDRFIRLGARAVIRPMRAYPEMVVRAMIDEKNAQFIENMFSAEGDEPIVIPVSFKGAWSSIAIACISNDIGTPVGYVDEQDNLVTNPKGSDLVATKGVQQISFKTLEMRAAL